MILGISYMILNAMPSQRRYEVSVYMPYIGNIPHTLYIYVATFTLFKLGPLHVTYPVNIKYTITLHFSYNLIYIQDLL